MDHRLTNPFVVGHLYTVFSNTLVMLTNEDDVKSFKFVKGDVFLYLGAEPGHVRQVPGFLGKPFDFMYYRFLTNKGQLGRLSRDDIHLWLREL